MANKKFPKLPYSRLNSWMFQGLMGLELPARSSSNTGNVGNFIDQHLKTQLNITNITSIVDLELLGIELKSKDISTNSDWSIGSMTLADILKTPYRQSSVFQKLQALLLVTTDNTFQVVKDIGLYYFDIDEIQELLENSYEAARAKIQSRVINHASNVNQQIIAGNYNAVLSTVQFSSFEKFQGDYGKFEFTNNGMSFMFRISVPQMRHLTTIAASQSALFEFN